MNNLSDVMQDICGLTDGLEQTYENAACCLSSLYCFESEHGCSVFAVKNGNNVYFDCNMDMFSEYKKTGGSVLYMSENKNILLPHSTDLNSIYNGICEKIRKNQLFMSVRILNGQ